ncbi:DUF222 domain-containing protein, partial [Tessaracoccus lubricantis]|uniref:DUF222 domain-containing protein n=1 Tax=Tessaracoccus lubricantis TaxID=545543 RepID=UPI0031F143C7
MEVLPRTLTQALANLTEADALARMAEVAQAVSISTIIDTYQLDEERTYETIEQLTRYGADGTASVGEFVALEVGAALGISPGSAIGRIADVLNVRDRHPVLWEAMLAGTVRFHQACRVASECVGLSADAVTQVDRKCAQALGQWPWARVLKELPSWIIAADPATATAREIRARKERKVHITEIKDGQIEAFCRLAPADGIALADAITSLAAQLPDPDLPPEIRELACNDDDATRIQLNARRAAALGHLARTALGQDTLPVRQLVITIDATKIPATDHDGTHLTGPARIHHWGTLLANRLPELL